MATDGSEASRSVGHQGVTALLFILLAGAVVRIGLWTWFQGVPLHVGDERDYDVLAKNLVEHREYSFEPGTPTSLRPPLYPVLVAGIYAIFGIENFQAVRLVQAGLGLLTVLLVYRLGAEVHSRRVGLWAASVYCFYPSMLGTANLLLTETLFTLLLCAACTTLVLFYKRGSFTLLAATGILLGLTALTRSVVWMSLPFLAVFVFLTWQGPWGRRLLAPVVLLMAFIVTLAPWSIRNTQLQKTFVAVDVMGGRNFMMGNYQHTPLYRSWDAIAITGEKSWHHEVFATYPPEMRDTQGKIDKLALRQGISFVKENPWLTLQRDIIKFFDFWGLERELVAGAAQGFWGELPRSVILLLAGVIFGSYVLVMFLGIFGMFTSPPADRRLHWFFVLVIAYICGMHTLVFAHSRYHLPIMPLVVIFAACAWVNAPNIWAQRKNWRFWLAAGLCLALAGGWVWGLVEGDLEKFQAIAQAVL